MSDEALTAVKEGNLEKLKELLEQKIDVNAHDDNGQTLLHHAVSNDQHEMVKYLLKNDADIFITTDEGNNALHIAITNGNDVVTNAVLENVARDKIRKLLDVKIKSNGNTALHIAAKNGYYQGVLFLLLFGANYEIKNDANKKPADVANREDIRELFKLINASFVKAKNGDEQLLNVLKKRKCSDVNAVLNCRNNKGRTILQVIILNHHEKLAENLLSLRTEMQMPERDFERIYGRDRLNKIENFAKRLEKFDMMWLTHASSLAMLILHNGFEMELPMDADSFVTNIMNTSCKILEKAQQVFLAYQKFSGSKTVTSSAMMKAIEEVLEVLGFDPDKSFVAKEASCYKKQSKEWINDYSGFMRSVENTIHISIDLFTQFLNNVRLIHAINAEDVKKVHNLLEAMRDIRLIDQQRNNRTVLSYAAEKGNLKIIRLLLETGAKVMQEGVVSPIYLASNKGHAQVVKLLLEKVDAKSMPKFIDCQQEVERTALHAAVENGSLDIVKILLSYGATYCIIDGKGHTPLDLSTNEEVSDFFMLIDKCFDDAKKADVDLVYKLKAMEIDELMAVANSRNDEGETLAVAATKAGAKNVATYVLKLIKDAKRNKD